MSNIPLSSVGSKDASPAPAPAAPQSVSIPEPANGTPFRAKIPESALMGKPTSAAEPSAAKDATPEKLKLRFRHEDVEVDLNEAKRLAQIGLSAQSLDDRRRQIEERENLNRDKIQVGDLMAQLAQSDPVRFKAVQDIIAGRRPAMAQQQDDGLSSDDGLTDSNSGGNMSPAVEARLRQLEAAHQATLRTLHQRDHKQRLEDAIGRHDVLRASPEAEELARIQIDALMRSGDVDDVDRAALIVADRQKRLVQAHLERERRAREEAREASPVRSQPASSALPRMDKSNLTYSNFRNQSARSTLSDWLKKVRASVDPNA